MLAIALIPGLVLLLGGAIFLSLRLDESLTARQWSQRLIEEVDLPFAFVDAVQTERTYSLRALNNDVRASADLGGRRSDTDTALQAVSVALARLGEVDTSAVEGSQTLLGSLVANISTIRNAVDSGEVGAAEVDNFYSQLAETIAIGVETSARISPNAETSADRMVLAELIRLTDLHSRSVGGTWAALANRDVLPPSDRRMHTRLNGAFHHRYDVLIEKLPSHIRSRCDKLVASVEWHSMVEAENALELTGMLPLALDEWLRINEAVSGQLQEIWADYTKYSERAATDSADAAIDRDIAIGVAALAIAAVTFTVAVLLAGSLIRRLRSLRDKMLESAELTLPAIVQRLNDGQPVDVEAELTLVDSGTDEIGQVATALNTAQRTAIMAAAAEARTRSGINRVFLDIAHRSQTVVHQQLAVLDIAQAKQNDPDHLELLFQLDHLATRARRNAENLLLLGGGQPGRRWRNPVRLQEIVRGAISETRDFTRVNAVRLPEVDVTGAVVADLIHLLAELIDNATAFSPPDSPVSVRANLVGKGVVVEVEDQGLGIRFGERERLNEILHQPSDFQEMALAGHRHLGLFVIGQLAQRHGISVSLLESAYGGIKAVALVPENLLVSAAGHGGNAAAGTHTDSARDRRPAFAPETASDRVPRMPNTANRAKESLPSGQSGTLDMVVAAADPAEASGAGFRRPMRELAPPANGGRAKAPLPKRQRSTHLVPQLRITAEDTGRDTSLLDEPRRRDAEQARNSMTAFQKGTRDGRDSDRNVRRNGWS
ncbi:nitrate- and nitrite sensing domain-containing protein [Nocardia sp. NPDC127606]|uniref:sensor histidine kinase n=1 Tax=Nocardia sp. NPDC127606 TaxID=3345406 RepID=UPI0036263D19